MVSEPVGQLAAIEPVSGKIEYEALLGIDGGIDLCTVEHQECLHGGVPDALVAIDERVALNQRHTTAPRPCQRERDTSHYHRTWP